MPNVLLKLLIDQSIWLLKKLKKSYEHKDDLIVLSTTLYRHNTMVMILKQVYHDNNGLFCKGSLLCSCSIVNIVLVQRHALTHLPKVDA
jgi:hypothetical protein